MEKFKNKYRVGSTRLSSWNYSSAGAYFVTLCTKDRECYFGKIEDEKMHFNALGKIAEYCWSSIPLHFPFVVLGASVIMPNHIHGIIFIDHSVGDQIVETCIVETQDLASLRHRHHRHLQWRQSELDNKNKFGPQSRNLASIIRGFKIGVTKAAKELNKTFAWQPRFHDHIVRDVRSLERIEIYIEQNPQNWVFDELYK